MLIHHYICIYLYFGLDIWVMEMMGYMQYLDVYQIYHYFLMVICLLLLTLLKDLNPRCQTPPISTPKQANPNKY
jgi:hypothetical protein